MKKKGFTLVELIVVIAIIAILGAIAVPVITGILSKSDEQNDEVNASLYTSVMQQFANEKVGEALLYPSLTTTGADSEYFVLHEKGGQGMFPGYNILEFDNDEEIYAAIRREAVIAIKAFSKAKTIDGYYVPAPTKEHYQYVYYYLTGEVRVEDERTKSPVTKAQLSSGIINTEDFWVYLSRDGGSGDALINSENGTGMVFVQIRQFGTDELLEGTTVTLSIGSEQRTARTGKNGTIGFSNVPLGTVYIGAQKTGAVSFPDSRFYDQDGSLVIKEGGYVGDSAANPYVITLKLGSLGSLGFYRRTHSWNGSTWTTTDEYITQNVNITSEFVKDTSRDYGFARDETYVTNAASTGGTQELLTPDGKFLLYGPYVLRVSATNFRTHTESVVSKVYGIDNYDNGGVGKYNSATAPYEYPIIMKRPAGTGQVSGVIKWERSQQPLAGTSSADGTWATGHEDYTVKTRVVMKNKSTGTCYYSSYFTVQSTGNYPYTISNLPDGTYEIYLDTPYGNSSKLSMSELPDEVVIDGTEIVINAQVYYADVGTGKVSATVTYDSNGNNDAISGASVVFTRLGSVTYTTQTTDDNGKCSIASVKRGFYQVKITLPSYIGTSTYTYKIFVDGDEDLVFRLPISTIKVSGTISGLKADGSAMDKNGSFSGLTVTFTRYNEAGTKKYSSVTATVTTTGLTVPYSVNLVPGMYKITTDVTCYLDFSGAATLRNYKTATTYNFSLTVDGNTISCHPTAKVAWKQNSSHHWQECSKCGTVFNKAAHKYSAWTASGASGCYRYCTEKNCNRTLDDVTAHDYQYQSSGSYAATCVTKGNKHYECSRCGYEKDEAIDYTGHKYGSWTSDGASTHSRTCKNSGCSSKETKDHVFNSWYWTSTEPVMCSNGSCCYYSGTQRRDCTTCGYYETNQPKVAHSIDCYMMRHYVSDTLYYNYNPDYVADAYFRTSSGRIYLRLAASDDYSGRRVFPPANPDAGSYGFKSKITSMSTSTFSRSSIFSNTKHSHLISCANRPTINGTSYYCYAPINHNGNPLGTFCGCRNKTPTKPRSTYGYDIEPDLNPAWDDPF